MALYAAVACWGAALSAPTLIQVALIHAARQARSNVATAMQTTVSELGLAAASFAGILALDNVGAGLSQG